jgi:hypothetical protein
MDETQEWRNVLVLQLLARLDNFQSGTHQLSASHLQSFVQAMLHVLTASQEHVTARKEINDRQPHKLEV